MADIYEFPYFMVSHDIFSNKRNINFFTILVWKKKISKYMIDFKVLAHRGPWGYSKFTLFQK